MTDFQDVAPEHLAKLFFHYHEALAPDFPCAPAKKNSERFCWEMVDDDERSLMVATARLVLLELAYTAHRSQHGDGGSSDTNHPGNFRVEGSEGKECGC